MKNVTMMAIIAPLFLAAGCAATTNAGKDDVASPEGPAPQYLCKADALEQFTGQKATQETGARILAASGARTLRWVGPGMAVTMDFRPERATIGYDRDMIIRTASCG